MKKLNKFQLFKAALAALGVLAALDIQGLIGVLPPKAAAILSCVVGGSAALYHIGKAFLAELEK